METSSFVKSSFFILFFVGSISSFSFFNDDIQTSSGPVRGTEISIDGVTVRQYLGIPYAKPPVGELRFKKPLPPERRNETIIADKMPPACIQYTEYPFPWYDFENGKSEDCLYLNIWVPNSILRYIGITKYPKYPVMFWIYGGGFTFGSNRKRIYNGQELVAKGNVVVVTINYRLGVFGFLTSGTEDAPGNVGIHDMLAALTWVNKNIAEFGGDPNQVTLAGESAGSVAVGLLCVSPMTKGLFKRIIMESGSPAYRSAENNTVNIAESQKLAETVGCVNKDTSIYNNPKVVIECLRNMSAIHLAKVLNSFHPTSTRSFYPNYGDDILPQNARVALAKGDFHNADVLIGNNHDEGVYQITTAYTKTFGFFGEKNPQINKSYGEYMIRNMFSSYEDPDAVIEHYLGSLRDDDYDQVREKLYTSIGDYTVLCPTVYVAEAYSGAGNKVYYYFFTHRPSTTPWANWTGVVHYEEVQFVFGLPLQYPKKYTSDEVVLSRRMVKIWTDFVKCGIPGTRDWPLYSRDKPTYVKLDTEPRRIYGQGPHRNNCDFFRETFGFN